MPSPAEGGKHIISDQSKSDDPVANRKAALRKSAKAARADAFAREGAGAGARLAEQGLRFATPAQGCAVSGFWSIGDEIDCLGLLGALHGQGHPTALPVIAGKNRPLVFRAWSPGDEMAEGVWGIREPFETQSVVVPDIVLVPLLAFDRRGYRLGYGGGFYDRSIAEIRAVKPVVAIGVAFAAQEVDAVPHNSYDEPLEWVLTPSGPIKCTGPEVS